MERYGAHVVRAWAPRVVAMTGTVGKTATKELVADVLATRFTVFRTPGNFSGRFGLAVALGGLRPEHEVAVVEMATGHFGEIDAMCAMAPPEVARGDRRRTPPTWWPWATSTGWPAEKATLVAHLPGRRTGRAQRRRPPGGRHGRGQPRAGGHVRRRTDAGVPGDRGGVTASGTTFTCHHDGWQERVVVPLPRCPQRRCRAWPPWP